MLAKKKTPAKNNVAVKYAAWLHDDEIEGRLYDSLDALIKAADEEGWDEDTEFTVYEVRPVGKLGESKRTYVPLG